MNYLFSKQGILSEINDVGGTTLSGNPRLYDTQIHVCMHIYTWSVYVYMYHSRTDYVGLYRYPRLHCAPSRKEGAPTLCGSSHLTDGGFLGAYNGQLNVDWVAPYQRYRCDEEWPIVGRIGYVALWTALPLSPSLSFEILRADIVVRETLSSPLPRLFSSRAPG